MSSDADFTASKVESIASKQGTEAAFHALREDYDNFAKTHGGVNSRDTSNYWFDVAYSLQDHKVLKDLSVVWAKEAMGVYSRDGLTKFDLEQIKDRQWPNRTDMDRTMTDQLLAQYDKLKHAHDDSEGGFIGIGAHEKDAITLKDADSRIAQIDGEQRARNLMRPLIQTNDGIEAHSLFHKIDATPGGDVDGEIDKDDLDRFLKHHQYKAQTGQLDVLSAEQRKVDDDEVNFATSMRNNWDRPQMQTLRGVRGRYRDDNNEVRTEYHGDINIDRLVEKGGFRDRADLFARNELERSNAPVEKLERTADNVEMKKTEANAPQTAQNADLKPTESFELHRKAIDKLMADSLQQAGEGPYQAAARMLPGASHAEIMRLAHIMKHSYQDTSGDQTDRLVKLKPQYQWLNEDNFHCIIGKSSSLQQRLAALSKDG